MDIEKPVRRGLWQHSFILIKREIFFGGKREDFVNLRGHADNRRD